MNYPQWRRMELLVVFMASAVLGGLFAWLAITKELAFLWWFAGPFLVLVPLSAWKAAKPDRVFENEQEKYHRFTRRHPVLSSLLIVGGMAGALWTIGSVLLRVLAAFTK